MNQTKEFVVRGIQPNAYVRQGGDGTVNNLTVAGNLTVLGNFNFGDVTADILTINGTINLASFTAGSILYVGATKNISQSNSTFFFDYTNNRLGIGTNSPTQSIETTGNIIGGQGFSMGKGLTNTSLGFGFGRNFTTGAMFDSGRYGYQFTRPGNADRLDMEVYDGSGTLITAKAFTIGSTGNVGIGTNSPSETLHVVDSRTSNGSAGLYLQKTGVTAGTAYGLDFDVNGGNGTNVGVYGSARSGASGNRAIMIPSNNVAGANNYAIYSESPAQSYFAGNVGIGTTTPDYGITLQRSSNEDKFASISVKNTSSGSAALAQLFVQNDSNYYIGNAIYGSGYTGTLYGLSKANMAEMTASASSVVYGAYSNNSAYMITNAVIRTTWDTSGDLTQAGNVKLSTAGNGFYVKEGSNATMGTATLSGGTATVSTTKVTANSRIFLTVNGGTLTNVGAVYVSARSAGTSFTITSLNVLDSSDVAWLIVEPA